MGSGEGAGGGGIIGEVRRERGKEREGGSRGERDFLGRGGGGGARQEEREKYILTTNRYIPCLFLTLKHQHLKVTSQSCHDLV